MTSPRVHVVGIGADGWASLPDSSRRVVAGADAVVGGPRQLALLPDHVAADRVELPVPLLPALGPTLNALTANGSAVVVLASGDPMFFGIGATLVRLGVQIEVLPAPSSVSLACARLGWAAQDVDVVSLVGRPLEELHPFVQPGRHLLVLVGAEDGAGEIVALLHDRGYHASRIVVLERLGAPDERVSGFRGGPHDRLAIVAVQPDADPPTDAAVLPRTPGLPDDAFEHAGQITKREVRAMTLAALGPEPGALLWDVGAGSGSIGIEWMRTHPANRAIAIEPRADRCELIRRNARALGVPGLGIVSGSAPEALEQLAGPTAAFVGGGVSVPGVLEACVQRVADGGRVVANAVTFEAEATLVAAMRRYGGTLTRISVEHAEPIGSFTGWRPSRAVAQWAWRKS